MRLRVPDDADEDEIDDAIVRLHAPLSKLFHTHIAGVTFPNPGGGPSRISIIECCRPGDRMILRAGTLAEFPEAIAVLRGSGEQLGYLPKEIAHEVYGRDLAKWHCYLQHWNCPEEEPGHLVGATVTLAREVDPPRPVPAWEVEARAVGYRIFGRSADEVRVLRLAGVKGNAARLESIAGCCRYEVLIVGDDSLATLRKQDGTELGSLKGQLGLYLAFERRTKKTDWRALFAGPTHVGRSMTVSGAEIWLYRFCALPDMR